VTRASTVQTLTMDDSLPDRSLSPDDRRPLRIGVAIPAYRDVEALSRCLSSLARVAPSLAGQTVVVDDSGDGRLVRALSGAFPDVQWIIHEKNLGFGRSANDAMRQCAAEIVILLNDDVELETDPSPHLSAAFCDERLFAVTFQSRTTEGRLREGAKRLVFPFGMPRVFHNPGDQLPMRHGIQPSAYAVGGHAALRRTQFLELNGFDPLFDPFYWEDVDLCRRAAARGWITIFLPSCVVRHDASGAIRNAFPSEYVRDITFRNRLLFAWRHTRGWLRTVHELSLLFHLMASLFSRRRVFLHAFRAARQRHRAFHPPS
jgi:GT2 family glycosyltransferase